MLVNFDIINRKCTLCLPPLLLSLCAHVCYKFFRKPSTALGPFFKSKLLELSFFFPMSDLVLGALDNLCVKLIIFLLCPRELWRRSSIKSHKSSTRFDNGSVTALIWRATHSDVTGVSGLLSPLLTSVKACPFSEILAMCGGIGKSPTCGLSQV